MKYKVALLGTDEGYRLSVPGLRVLMLLVLPMAGALAQAAPLRIAVTVANEGAFRVTRYLPSSNTEWSVAHVRGHWEMTTDSATVRTVVVTSTDSLTLVHVEASEGNRILASADGAFVTIRRDAGSVSIEARNRPPTP